VHQVGLLQINIHKKLFVNLAYLQGSYQDAQKHKIVNFQLVCGVSRDTFTFRYMCGIPVLEYGQQNIKLFTSSLYVVFPVTLSLFDVCVW